MKEEYNHQEIELMAQEFWQETGEFSATEDLGKEKFYCLPMFPYPSGNLHIGHIRNITYIPISNILIKRRSIIEHFRHISNITHIPTSYILIEGKSLKEHP